MSQQLVLRALESQPYIVTMITAMVLLELESQPYIVATITAIGAPLQVFESQPYIVAIHYGYDHSN